jgi:hypothetical protein
MVGQKKLTEEQEEITKTVVDKMKNKDSDRLINLLRECNISDGQIMMTIFGIGTHTEYYDVLYNRINNQKNIMNEELFKKEVLNILHEIDRNEDE